MDNTIKILITGDFCPVGRVQELALNKNFENIFNDFKPILSSNDLVITNLECPLISSDSARKKTGPALKADPKTIEVLNYGGVDLVTMANNHIMDHGKEGLDSTIKLCNDNGISYVGAGQNLNEARKHFVKEIKGKKIAILNFAENEFSNTHGNEPGANPLSLASNFNDIKKARSEADYVIVIFHGGNEMYPLPSPRVKETLRFFVDSGADAVIAHHTHCYSGYENYNGANIFYGLGNFLFDYPTSNPEFWRTGAAVQLSISDSETSFELIPFNQNTKEKAGLSLLDENEKKVFDAKIKELNATIKNDELLAKEFSKFVKRNIRLYSHYLEPYSQRILHILYRYKIIPSFLNKKKRLLYLNLIRCESHRDVILKILDNNEAGNT